MSTTTETTLLKQLFLNAIAKSISTVLPYEYTVEGDVITLTYNQNKKTSVPYKFDSSASLIYNVNHQAILTLDLTKLEILHLFSRQPGFSIQLIGIDVNELSEEQKKNFPRIFRDINSAVTNNIETAISYHINKYIRDNC